MLVILTLVTSSAAMVLHFESPKRAVRYTGRCIKRASHSVWVQWGESACIMAGVPCSFDNNDTGDSFAPSPLIDER